jgi:hypothetical protein
VNCELGLAQRSVGAEPFGLFRFAKVPLPKLMAALATQFEGYGSPGSMEIVSDVASEFQIIDKVFGFRNHSFAFANQGATADAVMQREIRRIPYLVRNLINELQEASKLFVFHDAGLSSRQEIDELVNVIGSYNPGNTLLWVQLADPDHPAGSAYLAKPGLICGFLSHFEPVDIVRHVRIPDWLEVARKAHAIWAATRPQTT